MTLVGGGLLALEDRPGPAPTALAALDGAQREAPSELPAILDRIQGEKADGWRGIVIHHSATRSGSADSIKQQHLDAGLNGLGYHFVIGNGQGQADGAIAVSDRWIRQQPGAHTVGPNADAHNNFDIGICLVGDGERRRFTKEQLKSLAQLVEMLRDAYGIGLEDVVLHRDVAPTASPGRLFPNAAFRRSLLNSGG